MLGNPLFVVAVILESRSPGSVVIKLGLDSGTLRARSSWAAKTLRGFLLMSFPNVVVGNPLFAGAVILESCSLGSVVIKQGLDFGTLRAGSWWAACSPLG